MPRRAATGNTTEDEHEHQAEVLPVHPAADLFPLMSTDELKAVGEDIKANGLRERVTLYGSADNEATWQLLDGRNRLDAMELVGLPVLAANGTIRDELWGFRPDYQVDPYAYVLSVNAHRRHLTPEQKRYVIAKVLKAQPEKSNRQIAKHLKRDHKTIGAVRDELEARGELSPRLITTDTRGRKQPTRKTRRSDFIATKERKAAASSPKDRAEERSQQAKRIEECVQDSARRELIEPKHSDIERALPDTDRMVLEILEHDKIAPGYAKAVMAGIAARLDASGYTDTPRREPTITPDARS
jgi:hypothetical protein